MNKIVAKGFFDNRENYIEISFDDRFESISLSNEKSPYTILPGLFDLHTHGAVGYDFNTATSFLELQKIIDFYTSNGVTSVLATIMTDDFDNIKEKLSLVSKFMEQCHIIRGIHLEGPFLSPDYRGAQPIEYIKPCIIELFDALYNASHGKITYVTIAPEMEGALELIKHIVDLGIIVSLGHSGASYLEAEKALNTGATSFTHTFNGMRQLHHHTPSLVATALSSTAYTEVICDGLHLHPDTVKMLYTIKGDKFVGITDSLSPAGLPDGEYALAGTPIIVSNGDIRIKGTNTRAGSSLSAFKGVSNLSKFANISLFDASRCYSINSAKSLGIDKDYGSIDVGKYADFVLLKDNKIDKVFSKGKQVF